MISENEFEYYSRWSDPNQVIFEDRIFSGPDLVNFIPSRSMKSAFEMTENLLFIDKEVCSIRPLEWGFFCPLQFFSMFVFLSVGV